MFVSKRWNRVVCALGAGACLALAGCGDDVDNSAVTYTTPLDEAATPAEATPTPTETPTPTPTATETPSPTPSPTEAPAKSGGKTVATLEVDADPSGQLKFTTDSLETKAGNVEIDFKNDSQVPHDVRFKDDSGKDIGGVDEVAGDESTGDVEFKAGTYEFYCSVPGHEDAGMKGTLTVK